MRTLIRLLLQQKTLYQRVQAALRRVAGTLHIFGINSTNYRDSAGTTLAVIDGVVGRVNDSIGSNHLFQATTAQKPIERRGVVNLLTYSNDFSNAAWVIGESAVKVSATVVSFELSSSSRLFQAQTLASGVDYTLAAAFSSSDANKRVRLGMYIGGAWNYGADITIPASGIITRTVTTGSAGTYVGIAANGTTTGYSLTLSQPIGLFKGTLTAAEILTAGGIPLTTSAAASSATGPSYLTFDGAAHNLTSATGGGSTTGFDLVQCVRPRGGAGTLRTIWSDAGTNTGYKVEIDASNQLSFSAGNGTAYTTVATTETLPLDAVSLITVRDNGVNLSVQIGITGTVYSVARPVVSAGTAGYTQGKTNGAATAYFNGDLFTPTYIRNGGASASEIATMQAYARAQAGI